MKIIFIILLLSIASLNINAQRIGINTSTPDTSAALEIKSSNKGLLIPRLGLYSLYDNFSIRLPAPQLLVYNTNPGMQYGAGFYFNNGTTFLPLWRKFSVNGENNIGFSVSGLSAVIHPNTIYTLPQTTEEYDLDGNFTLNGSLVNPNTFTAPINGIYHFDGSITWVLNPGETYYAYTEIRVNGIKKISIYDWAKEDKDFTSSVSHDLKLNAGDKVTFVCWSSSLSNISIFGSYFSGHIVFPLGS